MNCDIIYWKRLLVIFWGRRVELPHDRTPGISLGYSGQLVLDFQTHRALTAPQLSSHSITPNYRQPLHHFRVCLV